MHEKNVWHRDVTPGNILLADEEKTIKFIDFGISKLAELELQTKHTKNVVTRNYRAPEIFFGDNKYNGEAIDTWSAGCIFAELLTTQILFPGTSDIDQLCKIFDVFGTPSEEDWPEVVNLPNYLPFNETPAADLGTIIGELRKKTD